MVMRSVPLAAGQRVFVIMARGDQVIMGVATAIIIILIRASMGARDRAVSQRGQDARSMYRSVVFLRLFVALTVGRGYVSDGPFREFRHCKRAGINA